MWAKLYQQLIQRMDSNTEHAKTSCVSLTESQRLADLRYEFMDPKESKVAVSKLKKKVTLQDSRAHCHCSDLCAFRTPPLALPFKTPSCKPACCATGSGASTAVSCCRCGCTITISACNDCSQGFWLRCVDELDLVSMSGQAPGLHSMSWSEEAERHAKKLARRVLFDPKMLMDVHVSERPLMHLSHGAC